ATGINGNQGDNSAADSGAVYVFTRSGSIWTQQAYVKASNTGANDQFGWSVALAADGNTLAVGAYGEASAASGINGDATNNAADLSGAAYVFTRSGSTWTQQAYVKASNTGAGDIFGSSVALAAAGNVLAVGASGEASNASGINGDQGDDSAGKSGAMYVFSRNHGSWTQQAYVKASNTGAGDVFGSSVALAADGNTLVVGANGEDSNATGINGNQGDNSASGSGAVYLY
ncbi:MAG: integrin, partial [Bacteroidota bacterium]